MHKAILPQEHQTTNDELIETKETLLNARQKMQFQLTYSKSEVERIQKLMNRKSAKNMQPKKIQKLMNKYLQHTKDIEFAVNTLDYVNAKLDSM